MSNHMGSTLIDQHRSAVGNHSLPRLFIIPFILSKAAEAHGRFGCLNRLF